MVNIMPIKYLESKEPTITRKSLRNHRAFSSTSFDLLHNVQDIIYVFCIVFNFIGNRLLDLNVFLNVHKDKTKIWFIL